MSPVSDSSSGPANASRNTWSKLKEFWSVRGGWKDLVKSPYFLISAVLLAPTFHIWLSTQWWDLPIAVLPNLLGFSLGGYAIMLAFGDEKFKAILARRNRKLDGPAGKPSLYLTASAVFLHFILVQLAALLVAIVAKSLYFNPHLESAALEQGILCLSAIGSAFGFFLFLYALLLASAAAISIFTLGRMFEDYLAAAPPVQRTPEDDPGDDEKNG